MARTFTGSTANYMECTPSVAFSTAITISAWVKLASTGAAHTIAGYYNISSTTGGFELTLNTSGTPQATVYGLTGTATASAASTVTTGIWQHIVAVFATTTSRTCYLNGTAGTTNTTLRTASMSVTSDRYTTGVKHNSAGLAVPANCDIAEVSLWNKTLTQTQITALAAGVRPALVNSFNGGLELWVPLYGNVSPEPDYAGGYTAYSFHPETITGTLNQAATHPPVIQALSRYN